MPDPEPLVVSFVSGKGGVGKTMLAVAFAREMSAHARTLLLDLDFFNRGLTGLMREGEDVASIRPPVFLGEHPTEIGAEGAWRVVRVAPDLFHVGYPDLHPEQLRNVEVQRPDALKDGLWGLIKEAAAACACETVVIDCHGGPDNLSFAACLVANYNLLISEPDRITFYGTLNFVAQLHEVSGGADCDTRLVFNKVVPAFSGLFLTSFYDRAIRKHFNNHPLLATFPLEVYLTKEFERTPFLTAVFPHSLLNLKTQVLIYDLLAQEHPDKIAPAIRALPRWMRAYRRRTLGKRLAVLDLEFVVKSIFAGVLVASITMVFKEVRWIRSLHIFFQDYVGHLLSFALVWVVMVMLLTWSQQLERGFSYHMRQNRQFRGTVYLGICLALWAFPLWVYGYQWQVGMPRVDWILEASIKVTGSVVLALTVVDQAVKTYQYIRLERRYCEFVMRAAFLFYIAVMPWLAKQVF